MTCEWCEGCEGCEGGEGCGWRDGAPGRSGEFVGPDCGRRDGRPPLSRNRRGARGSRARARRAGGLRRHGGRPGGAGDSARRVRVGHDSQCRAEGQVAVGARARYRAAAGERARRVARDLEAPTVDRDRCRWIQLGSRGVPRRDARDSDGAHGAERNAGSYQPAARTGREGGGRDVRGEREVLQGTGVCGRQSGPAGIFWEGT